MSVGAVVVSLLSCGSGSPSSTLAARLLRAVEVVLSSVCSSEAFELARDFSAALLEEVVGAGVPDDQVFGPTMFCTLILYEAVRAGERLKCKVLGCK